MTDKVSTMAKDANTGEPNAGVRRMSLNRGDVFKAFDERISNS
ncbi:hypothetical protein AWB81_06163 [Caballeronia arationis]|jgi:hypothetical protein|uniref:Uncharacterized protein n=1 Tax=Caballeronia arationis TaxID=1777142 RepID=A0A7Z7I2G2_9BURK|nr:hypothetical protein [Caballeronia arationis]SAL02073.1 hypothetical protein AWB81_06163 [Caballeronia arationis]SOE55560.1 hypothetical protein SAMN05446927_1044 [Caballeronia arationis]